MTIEESRKLNECITAGFFRRILALFYDSLLVIGIIVCFLLLITFLFDKTFEAPLEIFFLQITYIFIGTVFFTYFWKVNNGQTLGMQVWKIKVVHESGKLLSIKTLLARSFYGLIFNSLFGINYIYIFFNKEKKSLNDVLSKTKVVKTN